MRAESPVSITDRAPAEVTPANIHIGIHVSDLHRLAEVLESEGVAFPGRSERERMALASARGLKPPAAMTSNWSRGTSKRRSRD